MQAGPLLAVALLGGFAAGSVGGLLFSPSAAADGETLNASLSSDVGPLGDGSMEDKLRALQAENASLEASLEAMQIQIDSLANRREAVIEAPTEVATATPTDVYAEQDAVPYSLEEELRFAAYLENVEKKKEEEREAERERRRQEQLTRRVDRIAEELGLDSYQKTEMNKVLAQSETSMREAFAAMREGGNWDRDQVRQTMEDLNAKTNEQLGAFLTPDQLTQYQEQNTGFNRFGGGGGRGGDRPQAGGQRGGFNNLRGGGDEF